MVDCDTCFFTNPDTMAARRHESFPPWDEQVDLSDILEEEAGDLLGVRQHCSRKDGGPRQAYS